MEVDGAPLLEDASIRDFQRGITRYVADAVEQSLLLPKDMVDLRSMRQYEVFLELKRDLAMVSLFLCPFYCYIFIIIIIIIIILNCVSYPSQAVQANFRVKEMVNYSHWKMKKEEGRRIAAVEAFQMAEKSIKDLKAKLTEEEKERKLVAAALSSAEKQVKS